MVQHVQIATTGTGRHVVLDASVWVSRTITKDSNHLPARAWITRHFQTRGTIVAPTLFEIEIAAAISRVTKDQQLAHKEVAQLHRLNARGILRLITADTKVIQGATALAIGYGLRAGDAIYAALAQQLGIALVTFDTELLNLPATVITTIRP